MSGQLRLNPAAAVRIAIACAITAICCACSIDPVAGGGTDVDNGKVTGRIVYANDGSPAFNARIILMKINADPVACGAAGCSLYIAATDSAGHYGISGLAYRLYRLVAISADSQFFALRCSVAVAGPSIVNLGADTIRRPGAARIALPDSGIDSGGYFYIPGTMISWIIDSAAIISGELYAALIPAGRPIPFLVYKNLTAPTKFAVGSEIIAAEGDTIDISFDFGDTLDPGDD
jgi:hypothetical protein